MLVRRCRLLRSPRFLALDLEFVKHSRKVYARSLALVPFAHTRPLPGHSPGPLTAPPASPCSSGSGGDAGGARDDAGERPLPVRTQFSATPTVLELCPQEVMRLSEVLPCGHLLHDRMRQSFVQGAALDELAAVHHAEATSALESFLQVRRTCKKKREAVRRRKKRAVKAAVTAAVESAQDAVPGTEGEAEDEAQDDGVVDDYLELEAELLRRPAADRVSAAARLGVTHTAEALVLAGLQARANTTHGVRGIDPHGVPSVRFFSRDALELLHAAPVDSRDFADAARQVAGLHVYGRSRRGLKPVALLALHSPALLQAMLRRSFDTPAAWYAWLEGCASAVEAELIAVRDAHRANAALRFREFSTLKDLATAAHALWVEEVLPPSTAAGVVAPASFCKVYTYGDSDAHVLENTLRLAYGIVPSLGFDFIASSKKPSSRFAASKQVRVAAASAPLLPSPKVARMVDVTRHPLFTARGFRGSSTHAPPLGAALAKAAATDATAAELTAAAKAHDPVWDAQALACVCTATDIVRAQSRGANARQLPLA